MYMAMFTAAIRLRYKRPQMPRPFRIPWGNTGMWAVAGLGILGALACIAIGFFPPTQLASEGIRPHVFVSFLIGGILTVTAMPYGIQRLFRYKKITNTIVIF